MENYGATIKKIRENKGMLIKELYSGILSRTTAYRFENDFSSVSITEFDRIIKALGMSSSSEFFYLHEINKDKKMTSIDISFAEIANKEAERQDKREVYQFYKQFKDSQNKEEKFYAYVAHLEYMLNSFPVIDSLPQEFQHEYAFIENYLIEIDTWTLKELDLFPMLSCCFQEASLPSLFSKFKKNYLKYKDFDEQWERRYTNHIINYALSMVVTERYRLLENCTNEIGKLFENYPNMCWDLYLRIRVTMLQGFKEAYKRNTESLKKYRTEMEKIISFMPENDKLSKFYMDFFNDTILKIFPEYE